MMDGIIKADGTSRLMRAALPESYEEFRAQCAAGTQPLDVLFNAIGWSQMPTFLNKANLTEDDVAAMFGKDSGAVPNDLFSWIGQYNTHWWSRYSDQSYYEAVIGNAYPYASGYSENTVIIYDNSDLSETNPITIKTADLVAVDTAGNVSLVNPTTYTDDATDYEFSYNIESIVPGKYCQVSAATDSLAANEIFYVPSNAVFYQYGTAVGASIAYEVIGKLVQAGDTTYVHSTDRSAYPDSGTVDGLTYTYLGIPFDNAVTAPKIATGSYTGTGTYGSSNPNSLTFEFTPKIVAVFEGDYWSDMLLSVNGWSRYNRIGSTSGSGTQVMSWDGATVTWYSTSAEYLQFNTRGLTYYYVAIG